MIILEFIYQTRSNIIYFISTASAQPHVCTPECPVALPKYRPKDTKNCHKIGNIPINASAFRLLGAVSEGADKDKECTVVECSKRAVKILFSKQDLQGHNFGGLSGMHALCRMRLMNLVAELRKRYPGPMSLAASRHVQWAPQFLVSGLNAAFRKTRSNQIRCEYFFFVKFFVDYGVEVCRLRIS